MKKTKTCLYSGRDFSVKHGNDKYMPGTGYVYQAKLDRQAKEYPVGNDAKLAIKKNHKLFMKLLGDSNSIELDLLFLLKLGFDANGYFGSGKTADTEKQCYLVYDCYFHITTDNPQKIQIWKV